MSTATAPERSHAPYAEPDEYIDYQLRKTQTGIKRIDMLTAAIVAITVLIGYVLLFVLSDHWLFEGGVGGTVRVLMFLPVIGFVGWLIGAKVVWPALRTVSGLYAARTLEASSTEFRSGLLNLVDLKQAGREVSPLILATMEKRAAVTLAKFNVDDAIDKRPLLRTLFVLFGIVVVFCAYSIFSPKKLGPSVLRAIVPFTNVTPATQTEILEVKPGDAKLRAGGILPVSVQLRGEVPADVTLLFTTADRRFVDEPMQLGATTDPNLFEGTLGNDEHGLLQSFTYHVVAGDARSPEYRVEIITPPSATVTEVRYEYPEYTELDPRTQMGGAIDAWERTGATITAATNVPVKRAKLELDDTEDFASSYDGPSPKIEEGGKRLRVEWRVNPRERDGKFPKFYRIKVWDAEDTPDPKPAVYPINVRIDQPPQVVLIDPTTNLELPANGTLPLVVAARDQDFKLRTVSLKIARDGNDITDETLFDGSQQEVSLKHDFELEPLRLKAGDKIRIWVEAQDNRLPTHNIAKTPPIEITIKDKVTKAEAKKQLDEQKQDQQKRIDEANKKNNEQANDPNGQQQPPEDGKGNNDPVLVVRLFDEESNQPMSVSEYTRALGLREPLFRGYVVSDFGADGQWCVSTDAVLDGARRPISPAPRHKLTIRQELRQQLSAEVLDPGILHALPPYGDCRLEQVPANPGRVLQGRVNSALYREKPLSVGFETKYVALSIKPDRNDGLPFPLATLETDLTAKDRDFYCRMPEGMSDLRKFARQAAANRDGSLPDQVEIAKRLLARLRKPEFVYKKPEPGLPRVDTVEVFLLVEHEGDCKQFNSALALMLREFKIPARIVLGLKGGQIENGEFVVRWPGHAWIEAYLNGRWLILDATPADGSNGADQQQRDGNNPDEREQPQNNQTKEDQPQQDDKNSKGKNEGADKKQKGSQDDKNQSNNGGKSSKPSLKSDGTQDQEALEKIAKDAKRRGELPKKSEPQTSPSSAQREPQENSNGESADKPMPNSSSKPNPQDDPKSNDGSKPPQPNRGQQPKTDKSDNADPKSPNDPNNPQPSDKPNANEKDTDTKNGNDPKKADGSKEPKGKSPKEGDDPKPGDNDPKKPDGDGKKPDPNDPKSTNKPNGKEGDDKNADGGNKPMPKNGPGEKNDPSASEDKAGGEKPGSKPDAQKPAPTDKPGNDQKQSQPNGSGKPDSQKPKGLGKPETDDKQRSPDGAKSDKPSTDNKSANPKDDKPGNDKPESKKPGDPSGKGADDKDSKSPDKQPGLDKNEDSKPGDKGAEKADSSKKPRRGQQGDKSKDPSNDKGEDNKSPSDKPGDDKPGQPKDGDKGDSGQSKKEGSPKSDKGGQKPGGKEGQPKPANKEGGGESSDSDSDSKGPAKPGSQGGKKGKAGSAPGGGSASQPGDPSSSNNPSGSGSSSGAPEEANEEFTKEAANLVLKRLQKDIERGEVDQELLDELGWNEEQMKKFVERMQQQLEVKTDDDSPQAKAKQRQFEEMLKNLNLTEKTQRRDDTNKDKQTGDGIGPVRRPPPPEYRESFESYTKSLSKKKSAETPKK
ncbi:MAG: hypothetical protein DWI21_08380 [Planctomycetota bacterium]|nr:MAG: hypothetical protein DWI21_08380 [Planctomycetota bacterium]